jgi:predicted PolB exonuclease-like 3'-5' exonuclease
MYTILDLETRPDFGTANQANIFNKIKAPSNWTDPEKIKRNVEKKKQKLINELALKPWFARVVVVNIKEADKDLVTYTIDDYSEKELIEIAYKAIFDTIQYGKTLVTFNGKKFDIPVIMNRATVLDADISVRWLEPLLFRGDRRGHYDMSENRERSLDTILQIVFGQDNKKKKIDFNKARIPEIVEYSRDEMMKMEKLYLRLDKAE